MMESFRSSDDYDEQAHELYSEGRYDEALTLLREGLQLHPHSVELHVGVGYAQLAAEQYAWARRAFAFALILDPEQEDALAGLGEAALVIGQLEVALAAFHKLIELGYDDDDLLMLQVGRALFREGFFVEARRYFDLAWVHHGASSDVAAALGYTAHRLGLEADAFYWLRRAIELAPRYAEPRIYLANILYDRGENGAALHHFLRLAPQDHHDDLGIWRTIELLKAARGLEDEHADLAPWLARLAELGDDLSPEELLLSEIEGLQPDGTRIDPHQLELFGTLMRGLPELQKRPGSEPVLHVIETLAGLSLRGTWDDLLLQLQAVEGAWPDGTVTEFMRSFAQRGQVETGVRIPMTGAEAFLRGAADAGVIRIIE
jgi:tetratricopeptide (TPR) repeat protein